MSQDIKRPALPCFVLMFSKHVFFFLHAFFHYFDQSVSEPWKMRKMKILSGPFLISRTEYIKDEGNMNITGSAMVNVT